MDAISSHPPANCGVSLHEFAQIMQKLGCVQAINLDGGGSTTMVVDGVTVTKNANSYQRRVASSLDIIDARTAQLPAGHPAQTGCSCITYCFWCGAARAR